MPSTRWPTTRRTPFSRSRTPSGKRGTRWSRSCRPSRRPSETKRGQAGFGGVRGEWTTRSRRLCSYPAQEPPAWPPLFCLGARIFTAALPPLSLTLAPPICSAPKPPLLDVHPTVGARLETGIARPLGQEPGQLGQVVGEGL